VVVGVLVGEDGDVDFFQVNTKSGRIFLEHPSIAAGVEEDGKLAVPHQCGKAEIELQAGLVLAEVVVQVDDFIAQGRRGRRKLCGCGRGAGPRARARAGRRWFA